MLRLYRHRRVENFALAPEPVAAGHIGAHTSEMSLPMLAAEGEEEAPGWWGHFELRFPERDKVLSVPK
jgi:hypothetical protein